MQTVYYSEMFQTTVPGVIEEYHRMIPVFEEHS